MEVLLDVVSVEPQKDNTLLLVFENQEKRLFVKEKIQIRGSVMWVNVIVVDG
ncbi:MAG: hypothetical protein ABIA63_02985 [bacterium]